MAPPKKNLLEAWLKKRFGKLEMKSYSDYCRKIIEEERKMAKDELYPKQPILMIDDEKNTLLIVDTILRIAGINNTLKCSDSRQVKAILAQGSFSAVLLDLGMPHVSGSEILAHINESFPKLPVIIVTASTTFASPAECFEFGIFDYLMKPVDKDRLVTSIRRATEYNRISDENRLMKDLLLSDEFDTSHVALKDDKKFRHNRALLKTREEYRSLFTDMLIPTFVADSTDYSIAYYNKAFAEFSGLPETQNPESKKIFLLDYLDKKDLSSLLQELNEQGKTKNFEIPGKKRNGKDFTIILSCRIANANGYIEGSFIDITEIRNLQDQVRRAQRMEVLGTLASGAAHDFNNYLAVIGGYAQMISAEPNISEKTSEGTQEIMKTVQRAGNLAKQLLAFGRKQVMQNETVDINSLIIDLETILRKLAGQSISFSIALDPEINPIKADPGQIEQVIVNLVVNARDAMPSGGQLTIETQKTYLDEAYCSEQHGAVPGNYAMIAVSDEGCGMDNDTLSRIFEPFFTKKEKGRGTGLGLSTAFGSVKQHGGHITVVSRLNHGTTFRVYLPQSCTTKACSARDSLKVVREDAYSGEKSHLFRE